MESYGAILRQARKAKNISLETAAKETSISQRYIEALEAETTGVFNGEAYVVGFLRNYADYLEVDSQRLINLYHNALIQEQPVPEGLIEKPKPPYFIPVIILICFVVIATGGLITLYFKVYRPQIIAKQNEYTISNKVQQKIYELDDKPLNERVYVGDQIVVPLGDTGGIVLTVASDTNNRLGLQTPQGLQYFELSESRELDVDGDNAVDLVIDVWEISSNEDSRGAEVYVMLKNSSFVEIVDSNSIPIASSGNKQQTTIIDDNRAYPFTLNATFRNPCVFRYEVDRKESVENYYSNGDAVTMTANNKVRIWVANGNAVKFQVIAAGHSHDLEIGKAGEVVVQDLKWIRIDFNRYRLVVEDLD